MRSTIISLLLTLGTAIAFGQAGPQIKTGGANGQIQWPSSCTAGLVYSPASNTCVSAGSGSAGTNFGLGSAGGNGMVHFTDSTGPGHVLVFSTPPVNGTGTYDCPGPTAGANWNVTFLYYQASSPLPPFSYYNCDPTTSTWVANTPAYSSATELLFQNYNQQSQWSVMVPGIYDYPGTPYSNGAAPLNSGNATTADVADIEIFPNYNPPDFNAPDVFTQTGRADVYNCTGGLWGAQYSNCDLSVRGTMISMLTWLGTPQHGKLLARNAATTGTWTALDPTSQTTTASWTAGSNQITVASATGVAYGQHVVDTTTPSNITVPSVVTAVSGTTITLSRPLTTTASSDSVKFWNTGSSPYRDGVAMCGTTGSTMTFTTMPASGAFYMNWIADGTPGTDTANMVVDGGSPVVLSSGVLGAFNTQKTNLVWYGQRYPLTGSGQHTIVLTVTAGNFCPLFVVTPKPQSWNGLTLPNVAAGIAPPDSGGYSGYSLVVQEAQSQTISQLKSDGLNINAADFFNATWPEGKGNTQYCEYNYPCTYPNGLFANESASPHYNQLGNTFNAEAFLQTAGRTSTQVGDISGLKKVVGLNGIPWCDGFTPLNGQNIQYTTALSPVPCYTAASPTASGMTWNGAWSGGSAYSVGNVVSYGGSAYLNTTAISAPSTPAYVQGQSTSTSGAGVTLPSNVATGHTLVAIFSGRSAGCAGSCTLLPTDTRGDNTWTQKFVSTDGTNSWWIYWYTTTVHSAGPITINPPATGAILTAFTVMELSNTTETVGPTYTFGNVSSTNSFTPTMSPTQAGMLLFSAQNTSSQSYTAAGSGALVATQAPGTSSSIGAGYAVVAPGTYNVGLTSSLGGSDTVHFQELELLQAALNPSPDTDPIHWLSLGGGSSGGGTVTYTASHTAGLADNGKLMVFNCSSACALTLPNPQPSTTWSSKVISVGTSTVTVTLGSSMTFNGGTGSPAPNPYRIMSVYADSNVTTDYKGEAPLSQGANVTLTSSPNAFLISATGSGGGGGNYVNLCALVTLTNATCSSGQIIPNASQNTITISAIPGTYINLHLGGYGRCSDTGSTACVITTQFNSDTGSNYDWNQMSGGYDALFVAGSSGTTAQTSARFMILAASGSPILANYANQFTQKIANYAGTTFFKTFSGTGSSTSGAAAGGVDASSLIGTWRSTSAITSIKLIDSGGGNFSTGTTFTLYGEN